MAYLDEIAAIIEAGTTDAGTGSSFPIIRGHLPDSTVLGDRMVALVMTPGLADQARVEIESPGLQVLVRGASIQEVSTGYEEADNVAWSVKNALHEYVGTPSSSGKLYVGVWNESGPFFLGFDESFRPRFSNNLRIQRSRT
jgi:hypothetical protein